MARLIVLLLGILVAGGDTVSGAEAFILERPAEMRLDLREHIGKTYYQTLTTPTIGIDAEIDKEIYQPVTLLKGPETAAFGEANFDPEAISKLYGYFTGGRDGFLLALSGFGDTKMVPGQYREAMRPVTASLTSSEDDAGKANGGTVMLSLLASGSGTLVILDGNNYIYNVAYQDPNPTTGRSFAVSGSRKLLDASHIGYLRNLTAMLGADPDGSSDFYGVLLDILTASDTRKLAALTPEEQVIVSDFLATYTAELERHQMLDMGLTSPWEIDYAQVTLLADYTSLSHMVMKGSDFVPGEAEEYARGSIGNFKKQFTRISRIITTFLASPTGSPQLVDRLTELTPISDAALSSEVRGDVFRRVLFFLNNDPSAASAQRNGAAIREAMLQLLAAIRARHVEITAYAQKCVADISLPECFGAKL